MSLGLVRDGAGRAGAELAGAATACANVCARVFARASKHATLLGGPMHGSRDSRGRLNGAAPQAPFPVCLAGKRASRPCTVGTTTPMTT